MDFILCPISPSSVRSTAGDCADWCVKGGYLLQEEDVVDLVFAPHAVRLGFVVDPGQVRHLVGSYLAWRWQEKTREVSSKEGWRGGGPQRGPPAPPAHPPPSGPHSPAPWGFPVRPAASSEQLSSLPTPPPPAAPPLCAEGDCSTCW